MSDHEERHRALAYRLWEEAGYPHGRADEFWYTALEILTAESRPAEPVAAGPDAAAPAPTVLAEPPPTPSPAPSPATESAERKPAGPAPARKPLPRS